jgi:hypothetical protein
MRALQRNGKWITHYCDHKNIEEEVRDRVLSLSLSSIALQATTNTNVVVRRESSKKIYKKKRAKKEKEKKPGQKRGRRKARIRTTSLFFLPYVYECVCMSTA